jgi:hypothetical protein
MGFPDDARDYGVAAAITGSSHRIGQAHDEQSGQGGKAQGGRHSTSWTGYRSSSRPLTRRGLYQDQRERMGHII